MYTDNTYNGWSNRPTWLVKLWLDNDLDTQYQMEWICRESATAQRAAEKLEDYCWQQMYRNAPPSGMEADLIGYAMSQVNWLEIAEAAREDAEVL